MRASLLALVTALVFLPACSCEGRAVLDAALPTVDAAGVADAGPVDAPGLDARSLDAPSLDAPTLDVGDARMLASDAPFADVPTDVSLADRFCLPRPPGGQPFRPPPGSEAILAESSYCLLLQGGAIHVLGLDSGAMIEGAPVRDADGYGNASVGWAGGSLYACSGVVDGRLVRVTIEDGASVDLGGECGAVTTYGGGLLVMPPLGTGGGLLGFTDEGHAVDGVPDATFSFSHSGSRVGARSSRAITAWHSTATVELANLVPGPGVTTPVTLEGFDGWINGIDVLEDGRIVVATWGASGAAEIRIFSETGALVRTLAPTGLSLVNGMACALGAPPPPIPPGVAHRPVGPPPAGATCAELEEYAATLDNAHGLSMSNESCGSMGEPSNYLSYCDQVDLTAGRELHVVGAYEGTYPAGTERGHWECSPTDPTDCTYVHDTVNGDIAVDVLPRPVPIVLALVSYAATTWHLTVDPAASIERIIVADFPGDPLTSTVTGAPAGVPIEHVDATTGDGVCGIAYGWEIIHNTGGGDYRHLIAGLRSRVGLVESTFQGCYVGERFTVPHL